MYKVDDEVVKRMYVEEEKSISDIARHFKVSNFCVRSSLKRQNIKLRTRTEAFKTLYKNGVLKPPMAGRKHSDETKDKIGKNIHNRWVNKTPEQKEKFSQMRKEVFAKIPDKIKEEMRKNASKNLRQTIDYGTKLERYLMRGLKSNGYNARFHSRFLPNSKLEVDIFLPDNGVAIEIDGPGHFRDIFEPGQHQKTARADQEKNGLIITSGLVMIRIKNDFRTLSDTVCDEILEKLISILEQIKVNRPSTEESIIYI